MILKGPILGKNVDLGEVYRRVDHRKEVVMRLATWLAGWVALFLLVLGQAQGSESSESGGSDSKSDKMEIRLQPQSKKRKVADPEEDAEDKEIEASTQPIHSRPVAVKELATESAKEPEIVPAEKALGWLKNGNVRYVRNRLRNDGQGAKERLKLVQGQRPHTIILACADSRVPPEVIFDQKLGEIFVVRTAGEALDLVTIASIEYAVTHLHSRLLLVLGHTQCGAVTTALAVPKGGKAGSAALDALVADIQPRLKGLGENSPRSPNLIQEASLNAEGVAGDLVERSFIVRSAVEKGELTIQTALYHLNSGQVVFQR